MEVEDDAEPTVRPRRPAVMSDVGRLAGVSHQTVSRVINGSRHVSPATRERVLAAMRELGYRPNSIARALVTGRSRTLGVVSFDTTLYGPASTLFGIERAAHQAGYFIIIASLRALDRASVVEAVDRLRVQGVEGILVIVSEQAAADALAESRSTCRWSPWRPGRSAESQWWRSISASGRRWRRAICSTSGTRPCITSPGLRGRWRPSSVRRAGGTTLRAAGATVPVPLTGDWSARTGYHVGGRLARDTRRQRRVRRQRSDGARAAAGDARGGAPDPRRDQRRRLRRHPRGALFHPAADHRAPGLRRGRQPQPAGAGGDDSSVRRAAARCRPDHWSRPELVVRASTAAGGPAVTAALRSIDTTSDVIANIAPRRAHERRDRLGPEGRRPVRVKGKLSSVGDSPSASRRADRVGGLSRFSLD